MTTAAGGTLGCGARKVRRLQINYGGCILIWSNGPRSAGACWSKELAVGSCSARPACTGRPCSTASRRVTSSTRQERGRRWGLWEQELVRFEPLHYPALLESKPRALDQARPPRGWTLPESFALLRRRLEGEYGGERTREHIRVLRLLEKHPLSVRRVAVEKVLHAGATRPRCLSSRRRNGGRRSSRSTVIRTCGASKCRLPTSPNTAHCRREVCDERTLDLPVRGYPSSIALG